MRQVTLLAPRPRVEERLLQQAFSDRGWVTTLRDPQSLAFALTGDSSSLPRLAVDRGVATRERATIAALLGAAGGIVVNRAATTRLLADRLALFRHLIVAGIPVPRTEIAFGEDAALAAIERVGYPAFVLSLDVDPELPDAVIQDRDAAEAVIEHRVTLGHERMVLVQEFVKGRTVRLPVAGVDVLPTELVHYEASGAMRYEPYPEAAQALTELAEQVISRLGSGVYDVKVVEGTNGPTVVKVNNLVDFRGLVDAGHDVASRIAEFVLAQVVEKEVEHRGD